MSRFTSLILLAVTLQISSLAAAEEVPLGFFASAAESQKQAEAVFLETPDPEKARQW